MLNLDRSTWRRVKFGDVVSVSREKCDPESDGIERFIAGEHMDTDELRISRWGNVGDCYLGPAFHRRFHTGDILYGSRRTYLRKVAVAEFDGVTANTTFVVRPTDPGILLPDFLPFIMTTESFHRHAIDKSRGSVNPYVNWPDIACYELDLPPLDHQRRISDLLWPVELHVRSLRNVVGAIGRTMKDYRLQALASGEERLAGDVFDITMGRQRSPRHTSGVRPRPYLRAANVKHGELLLDDILEMDFSESEEETFSLRMGDVLVTEGCGSAEQVGAPAIWKGDIQGPVCFQNTLLRYRALDGVTDSRWMWHWCQMAFTSGLFRRIASGTGILHVGSSRAQKLRVQVPSLSAQQTIAAELDRIEAARGQFERELLDCVGLRAALLGGILK